MFRWAKWNKGGEGMEQKQNANLPSTAMRSLHGEGQKLKKTYILRRLWRYFKEYKWLLALAIFLTLAGNALALVGPKLSGLAIDAIEPGPGKVDFATVFYYAKYMALFYALSAGMSYALARLMIRLSRNIVYRMRRDIFEKLVSLPVGFFDRRGMSSASFPMMWIPSMLRFPTTSCKSAQASSRCSARLQ